MMRNLGCVKRWMRKQCSLNLIVRIDETWVREELIDCVKDWLEKVRISMDGA